MDRLGAPLMPNPIVSHEKWITSEMGTKLIRQIVGLENRVKELERVRKSLKKRLKHRETEARKQFQRFKRLREHP